MDDYEVEEIIGEGNFTSIHKCCHKPTGKIYAIKVAEKAKLKRLHKERDLLVEKHCLEKLKDVPSVVNIIKTFHNRFNVYILLEYIKGKELWHHMNIFGFKQKRRVHYYFY